MTLNKDNFQLGRIITVTTLTETESLHPLLRNSLHQRIIKSFLKDVLPKENPEIIYMGGGTSSGKSVIRDIYLAKLADESFVVIDCDDIKNSIPEYESYKKEDIKTAASRVHSESSEIAFKLLKSAMKKNLNIIFDGTMKDYDYYKRLIEDAKEKGYKTSAVVVHVPLEVALEREEIRAIITERSVPKDIIELSHKMVSESFKRLVPLFDSYAIWDNSGDFEDAHTIAEKSANSPEVKVFDEVKLQEFYSKGENS